MTENTVKKQYKRLYPNGKETTYVKFDDNALTTDGILLPIEELILISYSDYLQKIVDSEIKYDFDLSVKHNELIEKNSNIAQDLILTEIKPIETKPIETLLSQIVEKEIETKQSDYKPIKKMKHKTVRKSKKNKDKFDFVDFILKTLTVSCSVLSVYFTGTYLMQLQNIFIAYLISFSMLMYGLIASQITRTSFKDKRYFSASLFLLTSIITIGFSMFTSLDVNMSRYYKNHNQIVIEQKNEKTNSMKFELLQQELSDNKNQIEILNQDIEIQQKQYVLSWDNDLKKNVIIEGRISTLAQNKIDKDNELILQLQNRNKEINELLLQLTEDGLIDNTTEETEKSKTLTDLIGAITKLGGNTIQMLVLIFPSIMIDMINVLSLTIINIRKEKEYL